VNGQNSVFNQLKFLTQEQLDTSSCNAQYTRSIERLNTVIVRKIAKKRVKRARMASFPIEFGGGQPKGRPPDRPPDPSSDGQYTRKMGDFPNALNQPEPAPQPRVPLPQPAAGLPSVDSSGRQAAQQMGTMGQSIEMGNFPNPGQMPMMPQAQGPQFYPQGMMNQSFGAFGQGPMPGFPGWYPGLPNFGYNPYMFGNPAGGMMAQPGANMGNLQAAGQMNRQMDLPGGSIGADPQQSEPNSKRHSEIFLDVEPLKRPRADEDVTHNRNQESATAMTRPGNLIESGKSHL
jgi:hypothetical protein